VEKHDRVELAFLTCAFYLGISVLMEAALFGLAAWKGSAGIFLPRWIWGAVFAVVWLVSFTLAWHSVYAGIRAKLPK
jgi:hypothetical protein